MTIKNKQTRDDEGKFMTKYKKEYPPKLESFVNEMNVVNFMSHCSIWSICTLFNVAENTIRAWIKDYSDFGKAYNRWLSKRNDIFFKKVKDLPPAIWIFLAKNWLKMSDKQAIELSTNWSDFVKEIKEDK